MNLFFLDFDLKKCAEYHCDKHVVKMILELTQMLYTAHHILKMKLPDNAYKPIRNHNHPMCVWVRKSKENYTFTSELAMCLSEEYTYRYKREHSCHKHLLFLKNNYPDFNQKVEYTKQVYLSDMSPDMEKLNLTPIPLCMPDDCKTTKDVIQGYRNYYIAKKSHFVKWKNRPIPEWYIIS